MCTVAMQNYSKYVSRIKLAKTVWTTGNIYIIYTGTHEDTQAQKYMIPTLENINNCTVACNTCCDMCYVLGGSWLFVTSSGANSSK